MSRPAVRALLASILASLFAAPEGRTDSPPPPARVVAVAAASDLTFALDELLSELGRVRGDITVKVTYGSSGNFHSQIANGAPFDVFFSANVDYVRSLSEQGLTRRESEIVYAVGRIVVWVPKGSGVEISRGLAALADPAVRRVAIANPRHAPYGRAAEAALQSLGLYEAVQPKLVFGENVTQAAQFVQSGAVDAGIIALSLAIAPPMKDGRFQEVPRETYPRLDQGAAILSSARDPEAARALLDFVAGPRGRAVLTRYGFSTPRE